MCLFIKDTVTCVRKLKFNRYLPKIYIHLLTKEIFYFKNNGVSLYILILPYTL